jgi:hypothetical protein
MIPVKSYKPTCCAYLDIKTILSSLIISILISCQNNNLPIIEPCTSYNLKETRLGESNYYLSVPLNFEISEARGKEGGLGYDIVPKDSTSIMSGFIEIEKSDGIDNYSFFLDNDGKIFAISQLGNKKVYWKIYQSETGYFEAFTNQSGNLSARGFSKVREEIDSLISIIATLKLK